MRYSDLSCRSPRALSHPWRLRGHRGRLGCGRLGCGRLGRNACRHIIEESREVLLLASTISIAVPEIVTNITEGLKVLKRSYNVSCAITIQGVHWTEKSYLD